MNRIAQLHRPIDAPEFAAAATKIRDELLSQAVDAKRGNLVADYGGTEVDAALLQAVTLRLLSPEDPRMHATVAAVRADLEHNGWLRRYRTDDGLGVPSVAFSLCTFWLIEAMARLGHPEEARALLDKVRDVKSPLGLLSEDLDPVTGVMWGNFPQAYSHVGLIHAAFAAAPRYLQHRRFQGGRSGGSPHRGQQHVTRHGPIRGRPRRRPHRGRHAGCRHHEYPHRH